MKYLIILIFIVLASCNPKLKLVGTWQIKGMNYMSYAGAQEMLISKDGKLKINTSGRDFASNWIYDKQLGLFVMVFDNEEGETPSAMVYHLEWKSAKRFKLSNTKESFELSQEKETVQDQAKLKTLLLGTWMPKSFNGQTISKEQFQLVVKFKSAGVLEVIDGGKAEVGTWSLSEDAKVLSMLYNKRGEPKEELMDLVVEDKNTISLTNSRQGVIVFAKSQKSKDVQKLTKSIVGKWTNTEGITIIFEANGELNILDKGELDLDKTAQWKVSEDGNFLVLNSADREEGYLLFELVDKNTLKITEVETEIFTRVK